MCLDAISFSRMTAAACCFTTAVLFTLCANGAVYYVDSVNGNDGNGGTSPETAWATLGKINGTTFAPGDRILLRAGGAWAGRLHPKGSGTEGAPITISSYGSGPKPYIAGEGIDAAVYLYNQEYWEINGLEVTNTDGSDDDQGDLFGIYVLARTTERTYRHIYINDCYVHDVNGKVAGKRRGGIHVHIKDSDSARFDDLRITNNRVEHVGGVGIGNASSCGDMEFTDTGEIEHNLWTNVYVASNVIDSSGRNAIIARVSKNAVYEHNVLANSSRYSTGHSIFCFDTSGIKIQHNEAYGNVGPGGHDRGGFDADWNCIDTIIQYNYSHDNHWFCGIMKRRNRNVVIRYNLSQNDDKGIYFYGFENEQLAEDVHIYNNTHFVRAGLDVEVFAENRTPLNTLFENNIFFFEGEGRWGSNARGINTTFHNNLYFNISAHETDISPVYADPMFVRPDSGGMDIDTLEGYMLQPGSPAIDAGITVAGASSVDFWGNPVPFGGRTDIGVHEFRPPVSTLPAGWVNEDVGETGPVGSAVYSDGMMTVNGSGPGLGEPADAFHFVHTAMDGDGDMNVRVRAVEHTADDVSAGMMIRESTDADAPYAFLAVTSSGELSFRHAVPSPSVVHTIFTDGFEDGFEVGGWTNMGAYWSETAYEDNPRSGKMDGTEAIATYQSTAGYTGIHVTYFRKGKDIDEGDTFSCEWFDGNRWRTVEETAGIASEWQFVDVDLPAGAADNPEFALRFSVDAASTHYAYVDVVEIRGSSPGRTMVAYSGHDVSLPVWLRLNRRDDNISAFHSDNGVSWTELGSTVVPMDVDVRVGLAVNACTDETICTAEFDEIAGPFAVADVNRDYSVDAVDIQQVINVVLGLQAAFDCDINDDGIVNALDVQSTINMVLNLN